MPCEKQISFKAFIRVPTPYCILLVISNIFGYSLHKDPRCSFWYILYDNVLRMHKLIYWLWYLIKLIKFHKVHKIDPLQHFMQWWHHNYYFCFIHLLRIISQDLKKKWTFVVLRLIKKNTIPYFLKLFYCYFVLF